MSKEDAKAHHLIDGYDFPGYGDSYNGLALPMGTTSEGDSNGQYNQFSSESSLLTPTNFDDHFLDPESQGVAQYRENTPILSSSITDDGADNPDQASRHKLQRVPVIKTSITKDPHMPPEYPNQSPTRSSHSGSNSGSAKDQPSRSAPGRHKYLVKLAPDQPPTTAGKPRLRVHVACVPCRKRKVRCDGAKPVCLNCSSRKNVYARPCTYDPVPKRRGRDRRPGGRQRNPSSEIRDDSRHSRDDSSSSGSSKQDPLPADVGNPSSSTSILHHEIPNDHIYTTSSPFLSNLDYVSPWGSFASEMPRKGDGSTGEVLSFGSLGMDGAYHVNIYNICSSHG